MMRFQNWRTFLRKWLSRVTRVGKRFRFRSQLRPLLVPFEDRLAPALWGGPAFAVGDINGDGFADLLTTPGAGFPAQVRVLSGRDGSELRSFFPYGETFLGGVSLATGDVNGDGAADIVTGVASGAGPHVKVFDGKTGAEIRSFFAFDEAFLGGVSVAAGDVNRDGKADIVVGAGPGAGPHVKVFDGATGIEIRSFFAFDGAFRGGVNVAAGDTDGDGAADIVVGAGPGADPHIQIFSGANGRLLRSFLAFSPDFQGGVTVTTGDVTGDGAADVLVGSQSGESHVVAFDGRTGELTHSFLPFEGFKGGVRLAAADLDGDGRADFLTLAEDGGDWHIRAFASAGLGELKSFYAYQSSGSIFDAGDRTISLPLGGTVGPISRSTDYLDEVGVYRVDGPTGDVDGLLPDSPGYAAAAMARRVIVQAFGGGQQPPPTILPPGRYAAYLVQNGTAANWLALNPENLLGGPLAFFVFPAANPDGFDHFRALEPDSFAFEDQTGGGDQDFNDFVGRVSRIVANADAGSIWAPIHTTVPSGSPANTPPTISALADQSTDLGVTGGPLPFTVGDSETPAGALAVSALSSNPALILSSGIAFGGSGANRTLTLAPIGGVTGHSTITVTVTDAGGLSASTTFDFAVVPPPPPVTFSPDLAGWSVAERGGSTGQRGGVTVANGSAVLAEGDSFVTDLSTSFAVPATASSLTFTYTDPAFDRTASGVNDAFEAALLDDEGHPLVGTIAAGRDAFFNITEGSAAVVGANTTLAGHTVTLDLSSVPAGTVATLVFRLVNNDTDTGTTETITSVGLPAAIAPATPVKFFVADAGSGHSAQYTAEGVSAGTFGLAAGTPSGAASDAAGDTVWEVDRNAHRIDVYAPTGSIEGSWIASDATAPVGVTVSGANLWLVDAATNRILRYAGGASFRTGSAAATDSFALAAGNANPTDLVTDGSTIWVTDGAADRIFVYDISGTLLGSWKLDADNAAPSGITRNPAGGTDLWVVDRASLKVFDYSTGTNARAGQVTADGTFDLGAGITDPEGIADPPPVPNLALTPAGQAQGFTISTFASGFPSSSGIGPLGIAFPASGGSLVSDYLGNVWRFDGMADGQSVTGSAPAQSFGFLGAIGLAEANGVVYMSSRASGGSVLQLNDDGSLARVLVGNLGGDPRGIAVDPIPDADGIQHLLVSTYTGGTILDIDPGTGASTVVARGGFDGVSTDGRTVYGANYGASSIQGFDITTGQLVFDSGPIPGDVDGTAVGDGTLAGYLFANTNDAGVWAINLSTGEQTQIAGGPTATRGDFVAIAPDGSLLLTQSNEIDRLTPPVGAGFGPFHLSIAASVPETTVAAGSQVLLSGDATSIRESDGFHGSIISVTVNGSPVDALDAAGNFFASVTVPVGVSTFTIAATEATGQIASTTITLTGTQASTTPDFSLLKDVGGSFAAGYARTSFATQSSELFAAIAVKNLGNYPANVPLLVGVTNISDPTVRVLGAAGTTPDGVPYYDFTGLVNGGVLTPGSQSGELSLTFDVPDRTRFTYDLVFYGVPNRPPAITSVPTLEAFPGHVYRYQSTAADPDGDELTYSLESGPVGMAIDASTGLISWPPTEDQLGSQFVMIAVSDGRGGSAEQHYTISASDPPPNRPPVITSDPVVESQVGLDYLYPVIARDPDGDPLRYLLTASPAGMAIDAATGRITWAPSADEVGTANVTVQVSDGLGGMATQSFAVCVSEAPGNHDPVIVSQPATSVIAPSQLVANGLNIISGPILNPVNNHIYYLLESASWTASEAAALSLGGHLATVRNLQENDWIYSQFSHVSSADGTARGLWIGLNDAATEGTFVWSSGEDDSYRDWGAGEPQNQNGLDDYVHLLWPGDPRQSQWNDQFDESSPQGIPINGVVEVDSTLPAYSYQVQAVDPDSDPLTYSLMQSPAGMTIDPTTGEIAWNPADGPNLVNNGDFEQGDIGFTSQLQSNISPGLPGAYAIAKNPFAVYGAFNSSVDSYGDHTSGAGNMMVINGSTTPGAIVWQETVAVEPGATYEFSGWGSTTYGVAPAQLQLQINGEAMGQSLTLTSATGQWQQLDTIWNSGAATTATIRIVDDSSAFNGNDFALDDIVFKRVGSSVPVTVKVTDGHGGSDQQQFSITVTQSTGTISGRVFNDITGTSTSNRGSLIVSSEAGNSVLAYDYQTGASEGACIPAGTGGLTAPNGLLFGNDGYVYVDNFRGGPSQVLRFDRLTGAFVDTFVAPGSGGLSSATMMLFGPDGDLYVGSNGSSSVLRYDGKTGAFIDAFIPSGSGGLSGTSGMTFGPDGDLYIASEGGGINRYDGTSGQFLGEFIARGSGGLSDIQEIAFGPDGSLYVDDQALEMINRYDGSTGAFLGHFIQNFRLIQPVAFLFGPDGKLYVNDYGGSQILRFNETTGAYIDTIVTPGEGGLGHPTGFAFTAEPGLSGRTVYLDWNQNGRLDPGEPSTLTDAVGNYTFSDLSAGDYSVAEVPQAGWQQTAPTSGTYTVTLSDNQSLSGFDFGNHQTGDTSNRNPVITSAPPTKSATGQLLRYDIAANDPDGDPLAFDLPTAPAGMTIQPTLGTLVWTPASDQIGTFPVVVRVEDGKGGIVLQTFQITVTAADTPPVVTSAPPGPASVGLPYQYRVRAQDAESDPLRFSLSSSPTGMAIDPTTGLISWVPTAAQIGIQHVVVIADDGRGGQVQQSFDLVVVATSTDTAPTVVFDPRPTAWQGRQYTAVVDASDPDGDPLTYTLTSKPDGMTITADGLISWTPTVDQFGPQQIELVVSDGRPGRNVTRDFTIAVVAQETDRAPVILSTPKNRAIVGREYSLDLRGEDEDGDPFTWSLVSGPLGMSIDPNSGTLRWMPTDDQMGAQSVVVRVQDAFGQSSTQSFTVEVTCVDLGPTITSTPPTIAAPGAFYFYSVRGTDPDNDPLTYSLLSAPPVGMNLDPTTGVLHWTPVAGDAGTTLQVAIEVSDGQGNVATQSFAIQVAAQAPHQPPFITSTPIFRATLGKAYVYDVVARDSGGGALTFALRDHPDGMTIDPATGAIAWTPGAGQAGSPVLTVIATDPSGALATQSYTLLATANRPPAIASAAPIIATIGAAYRYDVRATDPDGDPIAYSLAAAPVGMSIDSLGRIAWTPTADELGPQSVTVVAGDGQDSTRQSFTIDVQTDTTAPSVRVTLSSNPAAIGSTVTIRVAATDNVGVTSLGLQIDGQTLSLDATGSTTYTVTAAGLLSVVGTAADAAGNVGTATSQLRAIDPNAATGATVDITSPVAGSDNVVTYLTPIVGSIGVPIGDTLDHWVVEIARADQIDPSNIATDNPAFTEIARGTTAVTNGVLANFDPTLLADDQYIVRVKALDIFGAGQSKAITLNVEGEAKLGNFHLEFTDLSVPIAGIPISITRVYDTLQASQSGDFGFGWKLGVSDADIRETVPAGAGFQVGTRVFLTDPSGKRVGFTFNPIETNTFFGPIWTPEFTPDPGVNENLTVDDTQVGAPGSLFAALGGPYNPDLYTLTTPDGLAYRYSQSLGLQTITNRNGNTLTFTSDGIFSSVGVNVLFTRDGAGRITQITDPAGNLLKYRYDAAGNLIAFSDQMNNTTKFSYKSSPSHYLDTVIDPLNRRVARAEYDAQGRLIGLTDAQGNHTQQSFDPTDFTGTYTDGDGNVTQYVYNARGNVVLKADAENDTSLYEYSDPANPDKETKVTDPDGNATLFTYDARGNVTSVTDALGNTTFTTYDTRNTVTSTTDALGNTTTYVYDSGGDLIRVIDPEGGSRTESRDDHGRITSLQDSQEKTTNFVYDPSTPSSSPQAVSTPGGSLRKYVVNANGLITKAIDEDQDVITYVYNTVGQLLTTTDANGYVTLFTYDADGNRTSVTDPDGNITTFVYDSNHHVIEETDPLGNETLSVYDGAGNLIKQTDGDGRVITFQYDKANRVIFERWIDPDGMLVRTIASTYDAAGNLLTESDPDSTITRTYDSLNRIATESNAGTPNIPTVVLTYLYDANGNVISVTDNSDVNVVETYDSRNLVTSESWTGGGVDPVRIGFGYNANGQENSISRYADLAGTQPLVATVITYTNRGLASTMTDRNAAGTTIAIFDYTYDNLGLVKTFTDGSQVATYGYDKTGQLLSATYSDATRQTNESYQYDANGNRNPTGNVVGKGNELLSDGKFNYVYDNVGNLIQKKEIATGNVSIYTYDFHNRLVNVDERSSGGIILNQSNFAYDVLGRRIAEIDDGEALFTVYNGENAWADIDTTGGVATRYLFGNNSDELLARQRKGEGVVWYITDKQDSVRDLVNSSGTLINRIGYDSFGNITSVLSPTATDRYSFGGREYNSTTGDYFFRSRFYNAALGRFESADPLGSYADVNNSYRYVFNNPIAFRDPSGMTAIADEAALLTGPLQQFAAGLIGTLYGFAMPRLIFAGEVLASANSGDTSTSGVNAALIKTAQEVENINVRLRALNGGIQATQIPSGASGIWGAFASGYPRVSAFDVLRINYSYGDVSLNDIRGWLSTLYNSAGIPTTLLRLPGSGFSGASQISLALLAGASPDFPPFFG